MIKTCLPIKKFNSAQDYFRFMVESYADWCMTEQAVWIQKHVDEPLFCLGPNREHDGYVWQVRGNVIEIDHVDYCLRYQ